MTLTDEIKRALAEEEKTRGKDEDFQDLRKFYERMKKEGLAIKQPYTLPLMDTVGHHLYALEQASTTKR